MRTLEFGLYSDKQRARSFSPNEETKKKAVVDVPVRVGAGLQGSAACLRSGTGENSEGFAAHRSKEP
jgi:hypothetical protein